MTVIDQPRPNLTELVEERYRELMHLVAVFVHDVEELAFAKSPEDFYGLYGCDGVLMGRMRGYDCDDFEDAGVLVVVLDVERDMAVIWVNFRGS